MPCLLVLFAFFTPRLVIVLLVIFSDYIGRAFGPGLFGFLIPFLGFLFMPYTLLAYAWGVNNGAGFTALDWAVLALAVLLDLGVIGGGAKARDSGRRNVVVRTPRA